MKKQNNPSFKAHLLRGTFYLLLLLTVCVIPLAFAQRSTSANTTQPPTTSSGSGPGGRLALWQCSQDFEPALDASDDQAADDFVLTYPYNNVITGVRLLGEYSAGGGPSSSFNVYFYTNGAGNLPGTLIGAFLNRPYTGTPPDFVITLPSPFTLSPGTYWVSVQARQAFNPNGQWFGTTGLFNRTLVLPGRTRATATAAASLGTERTPACPTKCGLTRFSKSSALLRAPRLRRQRLPQLQGQVAPNTR